MKLSAFIFLLLLPIFCIAQYSGITDNGNRWDFVYESQAGFYCTNSLTINGDTMITGKKYSKIYDKSNKKICGIREDSSKKVFVRAFTKDEICTFTLPFEGLDTSKETLLYNFNTRIGDTTSSRKYDRRFGDTIDIKTIISDIQRDSFFGKKRSVFFVTRYYSSLIESDVIYEGVGSQKMLFNPISSPAYLSEGRIFTRCFNHLSYTSSPCLSKVPKIQDKAIRILNNPLSTNIEILVDDSYSHLLESIQLGDISGRIIKKIPSNGLSNVQINVTNLPTGIYFISFLSAESYFTKKITIVH